MRAATTRTKSGSSCSDTIPPAGLSAVIRIASSGCVAAPAVVKEARERGAFQESCERDLRQRRRRDEPDAEPHELGQSGLGILVKHRLLDRLDLGFLDALAFVVGDRLAPRVERQHAIPVRLAAAGELSERADGLEQDGVDGLHEGRSG